MTRYLPTIDVCLCTHAPRRDIARLVLESIAAQRDAGDVRLLVVDNASPDPLDDRFIAPIRAARIAGRVVREERLGIASARLRAIAETDAEWVLFVDDDTELAPDYLDQARRFLAVRSDLGCFGGKLLLPEGLRPPAWAFPFLPYVAVRDLGDEPRFACGPRAEECEPPTAGAFVRRSLLEAFRRRADRDPTVLRLGRVGRHRLTSCEDSLLMRGGHALGLATAYLPSLTLRHHVDPRRFSANYLIRLMHAYGYSHAVLEGLLEVAPEPPRAYASLPSFLRLLAAETRRSLPRSAPFAVGMVAYHLAARREHHRRERTRFASRAPSDPGDAPLTAATGSPRDPGRADGRAST